MDKYMEKKEQSNIVGSWFKWLTGGATKPINKPINDKDKQNGK